MSNLIEKYNVGIDIAKPEFVVTLVKRNDDFSLSFSKTMTFDNNKNGFKALIKWLKDVQKVQIKNISFTMESTGVYHESLANYLFQKGYKVHVVLPNKSKKYIDSLDSKSKTDKIDSRALGQMGIERDLREWKPSENIYIELKILTRERGALKNDITRLKNQLYAEEHSYYTYKKTILRYNKRIKFLEEQVSSIDAEIEILIKSDTKIFEKVKRIQTTPGIGFLTIAIVISETNGFSNFNSIKQLTSYAGYDVQHKESGSMKARSRISKKGNSHIRRALHMPSMSTVRYSKTYKAVYTRLKESKGNGLISLVAVQRKMLGLMYTLWKKNEIYIENHINNKTA